MKNIFALIAINLLLTGCESSATQANLYRAWMKTHRGYDITQAEWQALRDEYLLPGQDLAKAQADASDAAALSGLAIGLSAGSAGR